MKRNFIFVVTKGEDGYFIDTVPELPGVITQARSINELFPRVKEAIEGYLEALEDEKLNTSNELVLVGVNQIEVDVDGE